MNFNSCLFPCWLLERRGRNKDVKQIEIASLSLSLFLDWVHTKDGRRRKKKNPRKFLICPPDRISVPHWQLFFFFSFFTNGCRISFSSSVLLFLFSTERRSEILVKIKQAISWKTEGKKRNLKKKKKSKHQGNARHSDLFTGGVLSTKFADFTGGKFLAMSERREWQPWLRLHRSSLWEQYQQQQRRQRNTETAKLAVKERETEWQLLPRERGRRKWKEGKRERERKSRVWVQA